MIVRLLAAVLVMLLPATAAAHGEHGGAKPLGAMGAVTVQGYQVELLSQPTPLAPGQPSQIVAKIMKSSSLVPVSGGRVAIGLASFGAAQDPKPASEVTWAGSYGVSVTPVGSGAHTVRVVLAELIRARRAGRSSRWPPCHSSSPWPASCCCCSPWGCGTECERRTRGACLESAREKGRQS
jgi:hypothetical protein